MRRRFPPRRDEGPPVNERVLRFKEIRVVGPDGAQLGVMQSRPALELAREQGLDLVMVAPQAQPPVCRIIDHGKYKYETAKRERESKAKKKTQDVKGIKMRPNIAENDLNTLLKHARKFLEEGDKVRVVCQFRVRELVHPENGKKRLDFFAEKLNDISVVEKAPLLESRQMIMVLNPKPNRAPGAKKSDSNSDSDGPEEAPETEE